MRILGGILAAMALAGCVSSVQTYAANDEARALGKLDVKITMYGTGSGPMSITMPDGEVLSGRYSIIVGGSTSYGSLYATAYGTGGVASGSAFGSSSIMSNSSPGVADAQGQTHTAHCEVMNNNISGHGNGVCEIQPGGARYRIQY